MQSADHTHGPMIDGQRPQCSEVSGGPACGKFWGPLTLEEVAAGECCGHKFCPCVGKGSTSVTETWVPWCFQPCCLQRISPIMLFFSQGCKVCIYLGGQSEKHRVRDVLETSAFCSEEMSMSQQTKDTQGTMPGLSALKRLDKQSNMWAGFCPGEALAKTSQDNSEAGKWTVECPVLNLKTALWLCKRSFFSLGNI